MQILCPEECSRHEGFPKMQGSFSHSLAEYTLAACNWFAKDFPRLRAQQKARKWEPFNVEELRNRTMGVVGYGDIGQAAARIARAFGMRVIALRRAPELSDQEKQECLTVRGALLSQPQRLRVASACKDTTDMASRARHALPCPGTHTIGCAVLHCLPSA